MLYYSKGKYKVSIQPYIFNGDYNNNVSRPGRTERTTFNQSGKFNGWGAGSSVSFGFAEKWGGYIFMIGNSLSGDFKRTSQTEIREMSGVRASFINASFGIVRQFFGEEEGKFSMPVFFGPTLNRAGISLSVRESRAGIV